MVLVVSRGCTVARYWCPRGGGCGNVPGEVEWRGDLPKAGVEGKCPRSDVVEEGTSQERWRVGGKVPGVMEWRRECPKKGGW